MTEPVPRLLSELDRFDREAIANSLETRDLDSADPDRDRDWPSYRRPMGRLPKLPDGRDIWDLPRRRQPVRSSFHSPTIVRGSHSLLKLVR